MKARRQLYVFWDLFSLNPGAVDPRVACGQLRRVLGCYGEVVAMYGYGLRRVYNWVPEGLLRRYAPERMNKGEGSGRVGVGGKTG